MVGAPTRAYASGEAKLFCAGLMPPHKARGHKEPGSPRTDWLLQLPLVLGARLLCLQTPMPLDRKALNVEAWV